VLNMSLSERTRMAQAAQASGGVGVQHIAFDSRDLFASVERLQRAGVRFVPISDNYYDDLPTRFELEPGFVQRLRAAGILFDRGAQGDYLHAYTEGYAGAGFFFELVQRFNGYDGYGAVNAPARMASQAQEEQQ
jgi:4-hydroxyphenylpyruvate dioxygenase